MWVNEPENTDKICLHLITGVIKNQLSSDGILPVATFRSLVSNKLKKKTNYVLEGKKQKTFAEAGDGVETPLLRKHSDSLRVISEVGG